MSEHSTYEEPAEANDSDKQRLNKQNPQHSEELLWTGRPFLNLAVKYELTSERLRIIRGIIGRQIEEVELIRVDDYDVEQSIFERMFGLGDVIIYADDPSLARKQNNEAALNEDSPHSPQIILRNISNPLQVHNLIRNATIAERDRRGLKYQEET